MTPTQKSVDTREKMLEVAERLFAERGYDGAHLERIATEVGVRKTALYYYFDSKEALYVAVLERMLDVVLETFLPVFTFDQPVRARTARLVHAGNLLLANHPNYSRIVLRIFVDRIAVDSTRIGPKILELVDGASKFFEEAQAEGFFRDLSPRHAFLSAAGLALFHYAGGELSAGVLGVGDIFSAEAVEERGVQFREILFHGVVNGPPGSDGSA